VFTPDPNYDYYQWNELDIEWSKVDMPWILVAILIRAAQGGGVPLGLLVGATPHYYAPRPDGIKSALKPGEYDIFVKLVCKINGISIEEKKKRLVTNSPEITVDEIRRTFEETLRPIIKVKRVFTNDI
jgi:hypothetical protein